MLKFNFLKKSTPQLYEYISKNILSEESVKLCFLVTFNMIISDIFPRNFHEIHQVSHNI